MVYRCHLLSIPISVYSTIGDLLAHYTYLVKIVKWITIYNGYTSLIPDLDKLTHYTYLVKIVKWITIYNGYTGHSYSTCTLEISFIILYFANYDINELLRVLGENSVLNFGLVNGKVGKKKGFRRSGGRRTKQLNK